MISRPCLLYDMRLLSKEQSKSKVCIVSRIIFHGYLAAYGSFQRAQGPHSRRGGSDETEGPLVDVVRLGVGHILDFGPVHLGQAGGG